MENLISLQLSQEEKDKVNSSIQEIENTLMPHLVTIPNKELKHFLSLGDSNKSFADKACEIAEQEPQLYSAFLDVEEFKLDLQSVELLQGLQFRLNRIMEAIESSERVSGHEAYRAALTTYSLIQNAAKIGHPGASDKANELGKRFPSTRKIYNYNIVNK